MVNNYQLLNKDVICISTLHAISGVDWHASGDYFATFSEENMSSALIIHRFSNFDSQLIFSKSVGNIQFIRWHPLQHKPLLYVACKRIIYCVNLKSCKIVSRFLSPMIGWITCFDVHRSGLNLLVGGLEGKVAWYDIDLSHTPFKTFNYHRNKHCVRACAYHPHANYQHLWATTADDGKIYVFYCRMFRDKFEDPILIPLKILSLNSNTGNIAVTNNNSKSGSDSKSKTKTKLKKKTYHHRCLDLKWHVTQPWLFVACSDAVIRKYSPLS
jgi:ribosome biogenesis protein ERB1